MPIPFLLMVAGGGAAALGSYLINKNAEQKEDKFDNLSRDVTQKRYELFVAWKNEKTDFENYMEQKRIYRKEIYEECEQRSNAVFERFGHPIGDVWEWPLPLGLEQIENVTIPSLPKIAFSALDNKLRFEDNIKNRMQSANFFGQVKYDINTGKSIYNANKHIAGMSLAALSAATERQDCVNKALTTVVAIQAENTKFE